MRKFIALVILVGMVFFATSGVAGAATLNVVGGQLMGASNVDVGGTFYNVEFVEGTCIALFDGCDEVSDFTFQTYALASEASQALLDQVFLDGAELFDTDPELTNGCSDLLRCAAWTLHTPSLNSSGSWIAHGAINYSAQSLFDDRIELGSFNPGFDVTAAEGSVFVSWSPVPEPNTALLLGFGLVGLGVKTRRRPRGASHSGDGRASS